MLKNQELEKEGFVFRQVQIVPDTSPVSYWQHRDLGLVGLIRYKLGGPLQETPEGNVLALIHTNFPEGWCMLREIPANYQRLKLLLISLLPPGYFAPPPAVAVVEDDNDDDF